FKHSGIDNKTTIKYFNYIYANEVNYYGKLIDKMMVIKDKLTFFKRWLTRQYKFEPDSASVLCSDTECVINGIVSLKMYAAERHSISIDTSSISYTLN